MVVSNYKAVNPRRDKSMSDLDIGALQRGIMYEEKNCITVDHFESERIGKPYYFLEDLVDDSKEDTDILRSWMNHFKKKNHPFAVVYDNKTRLNRLVIEKAGK